LKSRGIEMLGAQLDLTTAVFDIGGVMLGEKLDLR
jgi:hypothetical protein